MILVIMAAGMGSRYGGLKQVDPVGPSGEFILDYSIYDAIKAGYTKVVFIIKEENLELFHETIGKRIERIIQVEYAFQKTDVIPAVLPAGFCPSGRTKPWGTAHAVWCCKNFIDSDFAVINADDYYGTESFALIRDFFMDRLPSPLYQPVSANKNHYCMAGYILSNTLTENGFVARGVCRADRYGYLQNVTELTKIAQGADGVPYSDDGRGKTPLPKDSIASMNCWGFTVEIFKDIETQMQSFLLKNNGNLEKAEFFLPSVVQESINLNLCDVKVLPNHARWYGVTYPQDKPRVMDFIKKMVTEGIYTQNLWNS